MWSLIECEHTAVIGLGVHYFANQPIAHPALATLEINTGIFIATHSLLCCLFWGEFLCRILRARLRFQDHQFAPVSKWQELRTSKWALMAIGLHIGLDFHSARVYWVGLLFIFAYVITRLTSKLLILGVVITVLAVILSVDYDINGGPIGFKNEWDFVLRHPLKVLKIILEPRLVITFGIFCCASSFFLLYRQIEDKDLLQAKTDRRVIRIVVAGFNSSKKHFVQTQLETITIVWMVFLLCFGFHPMLVFSTGCIYLAIVRCFALWMFCSLHHFIQSSSSEDLRLNHN